MLLHQENVRGVSKLVLRHPIDSAGVLCYIEAGKRL